MRETAIGVGIVLALLASLPGSTAMSKTTRAKLGECVVIGGGKLSSAPGEREAFCSAIERAVRTNAPTVHYKVEVRVVSGSRISAAIVVNGRPLPEQRFAVMDRDLNAASMERFAESLASVITEASKQ